MTSGQDPGPPPDHARAETYLRLLAEAELRRIEALPRPDPLAQIGVPAPLRGPVRLVLPLGQRAVTAVQPLAENAAQALQPIADSVAQALQPLAENAARTVRPLTEDAARNLQPLADAASRTIQPLTSQLAAAALPAAEETARRLNPLVWSAARQLQNQLQAWRRQAFQVTAPLSPPHRVARDRPAGRAELSPVQGVRRLGAVAQALAMVGAIDHGTADAIMGSLEMAVVARFRVPPHGPWMLPRHGRRQQSAGPPAGTYLAAPVGTLAPIEPGSGLQYVHMVTMVIAPDRAVLVLAGWVAEPEDGSVHRDPWPVFGRSARPAARDDRGSSYALREDSGWSSGDGEWNSTMRLSPVPPAGTRWLELTLNPGSAPIRVDLAAAGGGAGTATPHPGGSPAERLIDAVAMDLLYTGAGGEFDGASRHDLLQLADIVTAFEAVGAIEPARDAVGRLITLADRIGADVPPSLRAASAPCDLPAAWASVLENGHLQDGPRGVTPAAAVLPELDGTRFVLAGLRSDPAGAKLLALIWGNHRMFSLPHYSAASPWSWSARDNLGRWHVLGRSSYSGSDDHAEVQLHLRPPLHPQATSLEVILSGPSGQVTATVPLDWRQP